MTIAQTLHEHYFDPEDVISKGKVEVNGVQVYSVDEEVEDGDTVIVQLDYDLGIRQWVVGA